MPAAKKVLIVGAGVAGTILAIALRRGGVEADMIDLYDTVLGVGVEFGGNSIRVLESLELMEDLVSEGWPYEGMTYCDNDGGVLAKAHMPRVGSPNYPTCLALERPIFARIARRRAAELGATLRTGITVETLEDKGGPVEVAFTDGSKGVYDVVVGADGAKSHVRSLLFGEVPSQPLDMGCWRVFMPRPPEVTSLIAWHLSTSKVVVVPLSEGTMYMPFCEPRSNSERLAEDKLPEVFLAGIKDFGAPMVEYVRQQVRKGDCYINYRPLSALLLPDPWYKGNSIVIGDGAHTFPPHLGSGAGMALEDAAVLAEVLLKHDQVEPAFKAFMARRFERCKMVGDNSVQMVEWELAGEGVQKMSALTTETFAKLAQPI